MTERKVECKLILTILLIMLSLLKSQSTKNFERLKALQKALEYRIYDLYPRNQVKGYPDTHILDACGYLELYVNIEQECKIAVKLTGKVGMISTLISISNDEDTIINHSEMIEIAELISENVTCGVVQIVTNHLNIPLVYLHTPVRASEVDFNYLIKHVSRVRSECSSDRMNQVIADHINTVRQLDAVSAEFDDFGDDYEDTSLTN